MSGSSPKKKFDLVISMGVLHHTHDCLKALDKTCKFANKKSHICIGLYHKYGRKPFLEFVEELKNLDESQKFKRYKEIHQLKDQTHLKSWFRDQVLHPHETQHTFKEISDIFMSNNFEIISTSINKFEKIQNLGDLFELEKSYKEISIEKLKKKEYFPGFFVVVAKNKN